MTAISINPAQTSPSESALSICSDTAFSHLKPLDLQECPLLLITEAHMEESRVQVDLKRITRSYRVWITMSSLGSIGALFQSYYVVHRRNHQLFAPSPTPSSTKMQLPDKYTASTCHSAPDDAPLIRNVSIATSSSLLPHFIKA